MEGGGAMEGRGSGVKDWRGEAHLGSSLPMSACRCPCPLVVACVHMSLPVSARHCLCLQVVACGLQVVPRICSRSWAVIFVHGCGW